MQWEHPDTILLLKKEVLTSCGLPINIACFAHTKVGGLPTVKRTKTAKLTVPVAREVKEVLFFVKQDEVRSPDPSNGVQKHFPHAVGKLSSSFLVELAPFRDSLSRGI